MFGRTKTHQDTPEVKASEFDGMEPDEQPNYFTIQKRISEIYKPQRSIQKKGTTSDMQPTKVPGHPKSRIHKAYKRMTTIGQPRTPGKSMKPVIEEEKEYKPPTNQYRIQNELEGVVSSHWQAPHVSKTRQVKENMDYIFQPEPCIGDVGSNPLEILDVESESEVEYEAWVEAEEEFDAEETEDEEAPEAESDDTPKSEAEESEDEEAPEVAEAESNESSKDDPVISN